MLDLARWNPACLSFTILCALASGCADDTTSATGDGGSETADTGTSEESGESGDPGTSGDGDGDGTTGDGDGDGDGDTGNQPALELVEPSIGAEYPFGTQVAVEWSYAGLSDGVLFTVELAASSDPNTPLEVQQDLAPDDADSGSTTLNLAGDLVTGDYLVRVHAQDPVDPLSDEADILVWGIEQPEHRSFVNRHYIQPGRDLVVLPRKAGDGAQAVFVGWRVLLGDGPEVEYELRRSDELGATDCNAPSFTTVTTTAASSVLDSTVTAGAGYAYCVRPLLAGTPVPGGASEVISVTASGGASPYDASSGVVMTLPLGSSCAGNTDALADGVVPGDLDGDGDTDLVIRFCDQAGGLCSGSQYYVEAFERGSDGRWSSSWCHATGSTNTPMVVWDLDLDGDAEVVSLDAGATQISVLDGQTGDVIASASNQATTLGNFGHKWYSRFNVAYLDGLNPRLIGQNTHFATDQPILITALALEGDTLVEVMEYEWNYSVGTHGVPVADIDGNGRDEIVPCGKALKASNGQLVELWTIPNSPLSFPKHHDDTCHPADLIPSLPGLEVMFGIERNSEPIVAGVGVVDQAGTVQWTRPNSSFTDGGVDADFHGWDKGTCFQTDTGAMECMIFELCEDQGCMGNQGLDKNDYWTRTYIFDAATGAVVQDFGPKKNTTVGRSTLDWSAGDGVVTLHGGGLAAGYFTKSLDLVGDARWEIIKLGDDQVEIHINAAPQQVRHLAPAYDPNYSKPATQHANGGYTYTSEANINRTFVLGCDLGPARAFTLAPGESTSFVCSVGSLQGFAGTVTVSVPGLPAGVTGSVGPNKLDALDIQLGPDESQLFRVFVEADADATPVAQTFRLKAEAAEPNFNFGRKLQIRVTVE